MMDVRRVGVAAAGFVGGLMLGLVVWGEQLRRHRGDLFSKHPVRRWVALSYLSSRPSIDNARLVGDYVRWEQRPALRRRGEQVLRQLEKDLA